MSDLSVMINLVDQPCNCITHLCFYFFDKCPSSISSFFKFKFTRLFNPLYNLVHSDLPLIVLLTWSQGTFLLLVC